MKKVLMFVLVIMCSFSVFAQNRGTGEIGSVGQSSEKIEEANALILRKKLSWISPIVKTKLIKYSAMKMHRGEITLYPVRATLLNEYGLNMGSHGLFLAVRETFEDMKDIGCQINIKSKDKMLMIIHNTGTSYYKKVSDIIYAISSSVECSQYYADLKENLKGE